MPTAHAQLQALRTLLDTFDAAQITSAAFCRAARQQSALLAALPPRYGAVLQGLLDRLEAGALFDEESCSFSQQALRTQLREWLEHAARQLG